MNGGKKRAAPVRGLGPRGMAVAWIAVIVLAAVGTFGPAMFDPGLGIVFGVILLITLYAWVLRRISFGSRPVPRWARTAYWTGGALMVIGGLHAPDAFLALTGEQGTATVAYNSTGTGAHGTQYTRCWIDLPNGNNEQLPGTGPCPAPHGTPLTVVYSPGGVVGPILGAEDDLKWWWAAAFQLAGIGLLTATAVVTVRDPVLEWRPGWLVGR
ncbi:hypothetical protein [Streptomyces sp. NBC_00503]|uniref:hypothetical protein n=1 Tax=Streptomyces sp. NBC_00503 TaxID=2903659 RepID=UPI002E81A450|nr:hypothetical protein [Streptomyces sp. NBC_00503]WUD79365.1 hypothetical protein OG490_01575 [Streptomyces sp. NBC_00503]